MWMGLGRVLWTRGGAPTVGPEFDCYAKAFGASAVCGVRPRPSAYGFALLAFVWTGFGSGRAGPARLKVGSNSWEERFYTPPPPGSNFRDCKGARVEAKASIHHPLWMVVVVVVYYIALPNSPLLAQPIMRRTVIIMIIIIIVVIHINKQQLIIVFIIILTIIIMIPLTMIFINNTS